MVVAALSALLSFTLAATEAPITSATVYGDRARVVRTAEVRVSGETTVEFPPLTDRVDLQSVRVDAEGAEVARVELQRVSADELEVDAAKKLLAQLDDLEERARRVQFDRGAYAEQLSRIDALRPVQSTRNPLAPVPKLDASGWQASLQFTQERAATLQRLIRERDDALYALEKERQKLAQQAQLIGGVQRRSGWKVLAHLGGSGMAKVNLRYVTLGATWMPRYELQLDPARSEVAVSLYGHVAQDSGDDWSQVALTLSTAVPMQAVVFPKVATWKIGEKDRFIPTPAPAMSPVRPPPPAPPLARVRRRSEAEVLRQQLSARFQPGTALAAVAQPSPPPPPPDYEDAYVADYSRAEEPMPAAEAYEPPPAPSRPSSRSVRASAPPPSMAAMPAPVTAGAAYSDALRQRVQAQPEADGFGGLSPPPAFRLMPPPPNSPAAAAGGYDLAFTALAKESIASGKGARRVALVTERWPVKLERRLFPALSPFAYLAAELKSPSKLVLPSGQAALFVGADPAGNADLSLVAPGESFTLPLGVDRGVKAVRNVQLVQAEKGFIGKDDVGEYIVTTELANPYAQPLEVRIHDQVPLKGNDKVEVKLLETQPAAERDDNTGELQWRLTVPPSQKTKVTFRYSIKRPKNWRLTQQQDPEVSR